MFCGSFLCFTVDQVICEFIGEFIFPVSLFIASRTSSELSDE